jgi:hypothetical protein
MSIIDETELLEVLACDIAARPPAPGPHELRPFVTGVARDEGSILVRFDAASENAFARFADAERHCCPGIGWEIVAGPALRITATPLQLDALLSLFDLSATE